jgi:isoleucyl-tRNA synthetase
VRGSLEAAVTIGADGDLYEFLTEFRDQLPAIFITSTADLVQGAVEDGVEGVDCPGLTVKVEKSSHAKCARCWNHLASVGASADHPELCERCVNVVSGI